MSPLRARVAHPVVALVATTALVLQTVLVIVGSAVLDETDVPPLGVRLARLVGYFTIQSNLLVAVTSWILARTPDRDGPWFRPARAGAVVGITVTGLVHAVLLRPLLDLDGADRVADTLLHVAVPVLAVLGWLVAGPRPRITWRTVRLALLWPVLWLAATLVVGAASGWYPYPFLDVGRNGAAPVAVTCIAVTVLFLLLFAGARVVDGRLPATPRDDVRGTAYGEEPTPRPAQ